MFVDVSWISFPDHLNSILGFTIKCFSGPFKGQGVRITNPLSVKIPKKTGTGLPVPAKDILT
jgi:hypothetical protein